MAPLLSSQLEYVAVERILPGKAYPLGATFDGAGTNFALFSEMASRVELCIFDQDGIERRMDLPEVDGNVWHGYVADLGPGQRYGYRVHGPHDTRSGRWCNPHKLLIDPYAMAVDGDFTWDQSLFGYDLRDPERRNDDDSAASMPKSVVVDHTFPWAGDRRPARPWSDTVIYEAHVKGLTRTHPGVPEHLRGTYAGVSHPATIGHLKSLGITAIELMPVHQFATDPTLIDRGLSNYWGYNTVAFFAPHADYAASAVAGGQVREFKAMVRDLHAAGIEVILDVVYNHTAEGNELGPTLSMRGIDNAAYYRLADGGRYSDFTGTGNSLNARHPHTKQLIMDSLRYWVTEMHVDGFRFNLTCTLARKFQDVDMLSSFFALVQQDPVLSQVKLIAEPWDVGPGGYQVGNFPPRWTEWNGKYRDTVRDFWRGQPATLGEMASRLTGSADLYQRSGRAPTASINFATCHDGFTLRDLVTYEVKRNDANGEGNGDGERHNRSWNCGVEGPTDDAGVLALRARQQRNMIATTLLSQGVPMLGHGDELGRTQRGSNNGYCHDSDVTWIDWAAADTELAEFTRSVCALRADHPVFRRRRHFRGESVRREDGAPTDVAWFAPGGTEMTVEDWTRESSRSITVFYDGLGIDDRDHQGRPVEDDSFVLCLNANAEPVEFVMPPARFGAAWTPVLDTAERRPNPAAVLAGGGIRLEAYSLMVLRCDAAASAPGDSPRGVVVATADVPAPAPSAAA